MKTSLRINNLKAALGIVLLALIAALGFTTPSNAQAIRNVVLVHGAFADGSSYKALFTELTANGYQVTVVQDPLTSLEDDVNAVQASLDKQDGPVILVGHSWGGAVITEAGIHPKVAALVYVAAYQPDKGETTVQWAQTAPAAPENGVMATDDKSISPEIERSMYKRSNTKVTEIKGSHVVFISQPKQVAAVIIQAANTKSK